MSESKAVLREDRDYYRNLLENQRGWYDNKQKQHEEEIAEADKLHAETVAFHQLKYLDLAKAVVDVYGISVDTLLKAHEYKLKQARDGALQDAYTEAIYPTLPKPDPAPETKPKGKN